MAPYNDAMSTSVSGDLWPSEKSENNIILFNRTMFFLLSRPVNHLANPWRLQNIIINNNTDNELTRSLYRGGLKVIVVYMYTGCKSSLKLNKTLKKDCSIQYQ